MQEFDILNEDGVKTGKTAFKISALTKEEHYLSIHMYIYNAAGEFLLQKRAKDNDFRPDMWDIHLGQALSGETSEEAALREIKQDIDTEIMQSELEFVNRIKVKEQNHFIDIYFYKTKETLDKFVLHDKKVTEVKFISKEDMLRLVSKMDYRPWDYRNIVSTYIKNL